MTSVIRDSATLGQTRDAATLRPTRHVKAAGPTRIGLVIAAGIALAAANYALARRAERRNAPSGVFDEVCGDKAGALHAHD